METKGTFQDQAPFFKLPKEIRLSIYDLVIQPYKQVKLGHADFNDAKLSPWPLQPGICRTCRLTRMESLSIYYATPVFVLNIQRSSGEGMVINWINRLAASSPDAFNSIKNISVIAGLGYSEPPKEYMINVQQSQFVLATRPCAAAYLYTRRSIDMRRWTQLRSRALKNRLLQLPTKEIPGFSVAQNLREVIAVVGELSGYGLYEDFPCLESNNLVPEAVPDRNVSSSNLSLLSLPKELRTAIYEYAIVSSTPITIGQRALSNIDLTDQATYPSLIRTCAILRRECLPIYFSCTHFILNIQRVPCEEIVLDWIRRCSSAFPDAFRHIQHVSVIAGTGIRQPPRQYEFYIQQNQLLSTIDRPILQPYTLPANRWSPPPWGQLRQRLLQMPKKGDPDFDVAQNLRGIVDVLARYSDSIYVI